jgi:hypothetical protein
VTIVNPKPKRLAWVKLQLKCQRCGVLYYPCAKQNIGRPKYCGDCKPIVRLENNRLSRQRWNAKTKLLGASFEAHT